jgi:hypothetical protein
VPYKKDQDACGGYRRDLFRVSECPRRLEQFWCPISEFGQNELGYDPEAEKQRGADEGHNEGDESKSACLPGPAV